MSGSKRRARRALTPFAVDVLLPPTRVGVAVPVLAAPVSVSAPVAPAVPPPNEYQPPPASTAYKPPSPALQYMLIDIHPVRYELVARDSWIGPAIWLSTPDHSGSGQPRRG